MSRRRSGPQLITIYWRDIPAQVNVKHGRDVAKHILAERFQIAIDRAAMVAGLDGTDDYVQQWRQEVRPAGENPALEVVEAAAELEAAHPRVVLEAIVANGGVRGDDVHG